ncbi:hypothetical protein [Denitrificimonas caeni]|uniref:hypothetical protein n=1 Tax=Denitrificimonas caeni TaxID=521720 RepID=UPI0003B37C1F|nr:hypothetical protein [Denitrificimonas caeni]
MNRIFNCVAICVAVLLSSNAYACSCLQLDLVDRFQNSMNVFTAKLSDASVVQPVNEKEWPYIEGTFKVIEAYKGSPQPTTKLKTGMGGADCGIPMTVARKYIIFQSNNEYIGICDGSATLNSYDEDELAKRLRGLGAKPASNKTSNLTP